MGWRQATSGLEAGYFGKGGHEVGTRCLSITSLIGSSPKQPLKYLNGNRD